MSKKMTRLFAVLLAMPLFFMVLNAQDDVTAGDAEGEEQGENINQWQPEFLQEGRRVSIGDFIIENPTALNSSPLLKKDNRPRLWRFFMHGVSDAKGYPVPWQALGVEAKSLDAKAVIELSHKKSTLPAVVLNGGESLSASTPVISPDTVFKMRGQTLRFFVWIKAENTGNGADLWKGAPKVKLTLVDGDGNESANASSIFKTRGTFPWFCYHIDMQIPYNYTIPVKQSNEGAEAAEGEQAPEEGEAKEQAEDDSIDNLFSDFGDDNEGDASKNSGLFITVENPVSGKAWFSTLSWTRINPKDSLFNPASRDLRLDKQTGSFAPNPDYDELPMHFFFGLAKNEKWNFLHGTKAIPDMTSRANLEKYLDNIDKDWLAMQYALPYLVSIFNNGKLFKTIDGFEGVGNSRWPMRFKASRTATRAYGA